MSGIAPGFVRARMDENRELFGRLVEVAATLVDGHDDVDAAAYIQLAADFAWHNHPGFFVSAELERLALVIGRRLPVRRQRARSRSLKHPASVLHVLSEPYLVGGHTRMVRRWIEHDPGRRHSLALTTPRGQLPDGLRRAVTSTGGTVTVLDGGYLRIVGRAAELRELAQSADLVVLHTHPYDPVPDIAFARRPRPPVVLLDHADHTFWLGVGVADLIANHRSPGSRITASRRLVPDKRVSVVPLPLDWRERENDRRAAKAVLGIPPDALVLVTSGNDSKLVPLDGVGLLDLVAPALHDEPDVWFLAIGASGGECWDEASRQTGGRVRALGAITEPWKVLEAADVYVGSYPFSSNTATLEAGAIGLPIVTFEPGGHDLRLVYADAPGLDECIVRTSTQGEFSERLLHLLRDPSARAEAGRRAAADVSAHHSEERFLASLDELYTRARSVPPVEGPETGRAEPPPTHLDEVLLGVPLAQTGGIEPAQLAQYYSDDFSRAYDVAFVVIAGHSLEAAVACVQSTLDTCAGQGRVQVVVVDRLGGDVTRALDGVSDAVLVLDGTSTASPQAAFAAGLCRVDASVVVMMTDDIVLRDGWFTPLLDALNASPLETAVTPTVESGTGRGQPGRPATSDAGVCIVARLVPLLLSDRLSTLHVEGSVVRSERYAPGRARLEPA